MRNIGSVPVSVTAKVYGKDECWVRNGIIKGWLPIGIATINGEKATDFVKGHRINYYISPKKLYEDTGFVYRGRDENESRKTRAF